MLDFTDRHVVVTGAGAGIGFGIARGFHQTGARVSLLDIRPEALQRARAELGTDRAFTQRADVREEAQVEGFFDAAEQHFGPVYVVVANAGIIPSASVIDMPVSEWDRVMETNARGCFLTCRVGARSMVDRGTRGKIITISSVAAHTGRVDAAHYCASKAAILMFTKCLALELSEHRINVNTITPGYVEVESEVSPLSEEYKEALKSSIPWGRPGYPEDIANVALFLASDYAEYITGEAFSVNGGSTAGRAHLPPANPWHRCG
jgi:3-oxoacyl-[acyl-carrier protein] reductase